MHGCIYAHKLSRVNHARASIWHSPRNLPQIFGNRYRDIGKLELEYFFEHIEEKQLSVFVDTDGTGIKVNMQSLFDVATRLYITLQEHC